MISFYGILDTPSLALENRTRTDLMYFTVAKKQDFELVQPTAANMRKLQRSLASFLDEHARKLYGKYDVVGDLSARRLGLQLQPWHVGVRLVSSI